MQAKYDRQQSSFFCTPGGAVCGSKLFSAMWKVTRMQGKTGANKHCQGARMLRTPKVCYWQCMGFSVSLLLQICTHEFIAPKANCHAESIHASPKTIACKTAKLFKLLQMHSQLKHTIITMPSRVLFFALFIVLSELNCSLSFSINKTTFQ